jgi:FkbM family methyltransferase
MRRFAAALARRHIYGRARYARVFGLMHRYAIAGLYTVGPGFDGTGEARVLDTLSAALPAHPVVVDAGANVGHYAQLLLDRLPAATVHCFEPSPGSFDLLTERLRGTQAQLHRIALGEETAEGMLHTAGDGDEHASLHVRSEREDGSSVSVAVRRLDAVASELGIDRVDFLKIDTEGHDRAVLAGAGGLIDRMTAVQFEFSDASVASRTFLRDFYELLPDFDLYRVARDGLVPLGPYRSTLEVFVGANYLALRRAPA